MPYEAKTDWKYDDTVTEKDLNRIEQGLKDAHVAEREALTLSPGVQVVEVENDTPFNFGSVQGWTLVNLLGRAGTCDDAQAWATWQTTATLYSDEKVEGVGSLKVTLTDNSKMGNAHMPRLPLKPNASYVAIGYLMNGTASQVKLMITIETTETIKYHSSAWVSDTDAFYPGKIAFTVPADATNTVVELVIVSETSSTYGYFDAIRLYEIPESDVAKINSMSPEAVAALYPFVDAMTNVCNPYAIVTGANLLPPFTEWNGGVSGVTTEPYTQWVTTTGERINSATQVPVKQGLTYTLQMERIEDGEIGLDFRDAQNNVLQTSGFVKQDRITATAPQGTVFVNAWTSAPKATNKGYAFRNPILTIGFEPQPFGPQQRSIWAAECQLAANPVDGSNPDVLYVGDDGLPYVLEKWEKPIIGIDRMWRSSNNINGMRQILTPDFVSVGSISNVDMQYMTKYDGTQLKISGSVAVTDTFILQPTTGWLYIGVSNTDSGWGEDYNPTEDEIKAYLLGWKLTVLGASVGNTPPYNGVGERAWIPIMGFDGTNGTSITPTTESAVAITAGWKPYRLQYLKAKPTVEPVRNYETGATLCKGANMVEVGSGIVIREKANPVINSAGDYIAINTSGASDNQSRLKHKTFDIHRVYRDGARDDNWDLKNTFDPYGKYRAVIRKDLFDPTAIYHVTYTMLDPTLAAPISGAVAANLRGTVSDLVQDVGKVQRQLSVVETQSPESIGAETPAGAQAKADAAAAASVPRVGPANKEGSLNVISDGQTLGIHGINQTYLGFNMDNALKGYIGITDPGAKNNLIVVSNTGAIRMHSNNDGIYLNGRNVISEIDDLKQSGVNAKQAIVDAINAQGGSASTADDWATLAQKIRAITRGVTHGYLVRHYKLYQPGGDVPPYMHPSWAPGYVTGDSAVFPNADQGFVFISSGSNGGMGRAQALTNQAFDLTNVDLVEYVVYRESNFENHSGGYRVMLGVMRNYNTSGIFYDRYKAVDFNYQAGFVYITVHLDVRDLQGPYYIGIDKEATGVTQLGFQLRGVRLIQGAPPS